MKANKFLAGILSAALVITSVTCSVSAESRRDDAVPADYTDTYVVQSDVFVDEVGNLYDVGPEISFFGINSVPFTDSYYDQLDETSQKIYNALKEKFKEQGSSDEIDLLQYLSDGQKKYPGVSVNKSGDSYTISEEDSISINGDLAGYIKPAFMALSADHPELSWISHTKYQFRYSMSLANISDGAADVTLSKVNFQLSAGYQYGTKTEMDSAVQTAVNAINGSSSDRYVLVKAIHDYLCNQIEYNHDAAASNPPYSENELGWYQTAYSAFYPVNGKSDIKTVCAGYAKSFKVLCDEYGIPCILVSGQAGTSGSKEAHAWNYVQMQDNCWYAVDVTWDDQNSGIREEYLLSGSNTLGFDNTTFDQSHEKSGNWSNNGYTFAYPELSQEKFDPENVNPVMPSPQPTAVPTAAPTTQPTAAPTAVPTAAPTAVPTAGPTAAPTAGPTAEPTAQPTAAPTANPTAVPTANPTAVPTAAPTANPTAVPTAAPTAVPTAAPTAVPTAGPTAAPTAGPTAAPTAQPTAGPTAVPTAQPTTVPTAQPTAQPTAAPTAQPTAAPTAQPTAAPEEPHYYLSDLEDLIEEAEAGSTIKISKKDDINALNRNILRSLNERGISLDMEYTYAGKDYKIFIPAGKAVLDKDVFYCGPLYLAGLYGNNSAAVNAFVNGNALNQITQEINQVLKQIVELNP